MSVSVLIPVYNAEQYVRQTVESALAQPEIGEVLLADDGSKDGSLEICRALAAEDERVTVFQHSDKGNHGDAATRNLLLTKVTCPFIAFLDADDYFLPGRFENALQILSENPDIDGVYCAYEDFYDDETTQQAHLNKTSPEERLVAPKDIPPDELFREMMVRKGNGPQTVWQIVARREAWDRIPPFNTKLRISSDFPVTLQLAATNRLVRGVADRPLVMRRIHETNIFARRGKDRAHQLRIVADNHAIMEYMWEWGEEALPPEKQSYVEGFVLRCAHYNHPLYTLQDMRPYRVFSYLRPRLVPLLVLFEFPSLAFSKHYWQAVRLCMQTGRINFPKGSFS